MESKSYINITLYLWSNLFFYKQHTTIHKFLQDLVDDFIFKLLESVSDINFRFLLQQEGALCAQHCLNALLQGRFESDDSLHQS